MSKVSVISMRNSIKNKFKVSEKEKLLLVKSLLKVTTILISISAILKFLGLDIFGAESSNKILSPIMNFLDTKNLTFFVSQIFIFIEYFIIFRLSCKNKNTKIYYLAALSTTLYTAIIQYYMFNVLKLFNSPWGRSIYLFITLLLLVITTLIIDLKEKNKNKEKMNLIKKIIKNMWYKLKRLLYVSGLAIVYQFLAMFLRNITYQQSYESLYYFLLEFDYIILLLITYYIFLKKETNIKLKMKFEFNFIDFLNKLPTKNELKDIFDRLKIKNQKFKHAKKSDKIFTIIYIILFTLSELFNLSIIIFVAYLNHTIIECLFIITSFFITRKVFGAFHLDSAIKCWLVSNISFYILNKLTLSITFSFVVPVFFGILLAFITSKFIKKNNYSLYRGIPKEDLLIIAKNTNLNKIETSIILDFYTNRFSIDKLAIKYHYSDRSIKRIKSKALQKINNY